MKTILEDLKRIIRGYQDQQAMSDPKIDREAEELIKRIEQLDHRMTTMEKLFLSRRIHLTLTNLICVESWPGGRCRGEATYHSTLQEALDSVKLTVRAERSV
jgi:hypothetical protein